MCVSAVYTDGNESQVLWPPVIADVERVARVSGEVFNMRLLWVIYGLYFPFCHFYIRGYRNIPRMLQLVQPTRLVPQQRWLPLHRSERRTAGEGKGRRGPGVAVARVTSRQYWREALTEVLNSLSDGLLKHEDLLPRHCPCVPQA